MLDRVSDPKMYFHRRYMETRARIEAPRLSKRVLDPVEETRCEPLVGVREVSTVPDANHHVCAFLYSRLDLLRSVGGIGSDHIPAKWIVCAVARVTDIPVFDIMSRRLDNGVRLPRQIAMYLCRKFTPKSLNQIGTLLNRDHTTVLYGVRKIDGMIKRNEGNVRSIIGEIELELGVAPQ